MAKNGIPRPTFQDEENAVVSTGEALAAATADGDLTDDIEQAVATHRLPDDLATFADRYERVVGIRDRFVWKWFHLLSPSFRLSTVDDRCDSTVRKHKTLLTFYVTLLDDLLEAWGDHETFQRAAEFPFHRRPDLDGDGVDVEYLTLTRDVWRAIEESVATAPYGDRWNDTFRYDLRQVLNSIRYAYLATSNEHVANMTEAYVYGSHNMVMFPYADVDLMFSSGFDRTELPQLRQLLWHAQQMARIGNWVSTWERELSEYDYSSGVVVRALERGVVTRDELLAARDDPDRMTVVHTAIDNAGIEVELLQEWVNRYDHLSESVSLDSVDVEGFLEGMGTVLQFHLGSRGLK